MARRIALLFEYPTLNGGERSMLQTLDRIDRREFQIIALAPAAGRLAEALRVGDFQHWPFEIRDAQGQRMPRETACHHLVTTIRAVAPDGLHANSLSMGRLTGAVADQVMIPCVSHLRDIMGLSRAALDDLNHNRALVAVSQATRDFHVARGLSAERTLVQHNGVDSERFRPRPKTAALCRELRVPESSFVILTVGQIGLRKGQDVLAAAAPRIAAQVPGVQFVIVGERHSAKAETIAFEADVKAAFAAAGLAGQLHLLGYRDDVHLLMNEADVLVHPAKQEPLGRVLLEAAAAGLPIVATDVGGTTEIVTDRVSARLVPPGDHVQLADVVNVLAADSKQRARLAAAARQRMLREFTPDAVADDLMELWRNVLSGTLPARKIRDAPPLT